MIVLYLVTEMRSNIRGRRVVEESYCNDMITKIMVNKFYVGLFFIIFLVVFFFAFDGSSL